MKTILITTFVLTVLAEGVAGAAPVDRRVNVTADPAAMCGPTWFCSTPSMIFRYDDATINGEVVIWGCYGCPGEVLVGMPSWMRMVPSNSGYDLVGRPRPGAYSVKSYYNGVRRPSLDQNWKFIPR